MNFVSLPHPNRYVVVEPLDYSNPYNYNLPHRHDYFEVILVNKGGGEQQIDFSRTSLEQNGIYVVYPGQIHLLKRQEAEGLLIQFKKDIFEFVAPVKHHNLYFSHPEVKTEAQEFEHLYTITQNILDLSQRTNLSDLSIYKSYSYLQIILITLIETHRKSISLNQDSHIAKFLQLVSQHIRGNRKVSEFARMLNVHSDKLTGLCKEALGTTPLKIIHEELLLEIKRMMVLGNTSLKEMAYDLNFESTAHFSTFVKNSAGVSPSELKEKLLTALL